MRIAAPVVFSADWFARHQRVLLVLLMLPFVGRLLRRVLAIRLHDVGWAKAVVQLTPHSYTVDNGDGTYTLDCRTHAKYAKRLHLVLWPLWCALHAWDRWVANPLMPVLNVGFDTLTVYPDPGSGVTTDGTATRQAGDETWAALIAGAGSFSGTNTVQDSFFNFNAGATSNTYDNLYRSIFTLDTSTLTANAVIASATFSLYGTAQQDTFGATPTVDIYGATPASNSTISGSDFSQCGSTSYTGNPLAYASWSTAGYNSFALNTTGIAAIDETGITKFSCRNANYDVAGVAPTWSAGAQSYVYGYFADQTGTANDPKLDVVFSIPSKFLKPNALRPRVFAPGRAR